MADTTRRTFLKNATQAAAGLTLAGASPAMAGMNPIYDARESGGAAPYHGAEPHRGWGAVVEYNPLAEVQPAPVFATPRPQPQPRPMPEAASGHGLIRPEPATARRRFLFPRPTPKPLRLDMDYVDSREHRLNLLARRTGESFDGVFRSGPVMYDDALGEIDHILRDWRRDEVVKIDRPLIDLLSMVQEEIGFENKITVVSGYRSAATNSMLRRKNRAVAKNSYHMRGMAVDIRLDGVSTNTVRKLAMKMKAGGVGYYPRAGFIHLDTGPVRTWRG